MLSFIANNIVKADPIIVRFTNSFPVSYFDNGVPKGMDVDIIDLVLSRANLPYKVVDWPFKRSLEEMKGGNKVHIMTNLSKNTKRSKYMEWIGPVRYTAVALIVLKSNLNLEIKKSEDLIKISNQKGIKFGDVVGASYSSDFDALKAQNLAFKNSFEFVSDAELNFKKLIAGRILGFFADDFEAQFLINRSNLGDISFKQFAIHPYRILDSYGGSYIGISKKLGQEKIDKIKKAFQSIIVDGSFSKIYFNWSGVPTPENLNNLLKNH